MRRFALRTGRAWPGPTGFIVGCGEAMGMGMGIIMGGLIIGITGGGGAASWMWK